MVIALTGLFDIAGAASTALDRFAPADVAVTVGEIDPDPFYDFTQERPQVEVDEGEVRVIRWPENRFDVVRGRGGRDLVVLVGAEPHLYWRTYSACIRSVVEALGCEAVVTVGSSAEAVPHTRVPLVTGSTTDAELARRLGIGQPTYQGVTGMAGVMLADLAAAGVPSVSLRVGVPHYLMNAEHPQAVAALQTHLAHVLNVPVPADDGDAGERDRPMAGAARRGRRRRPPAPDVRADARDRSTTAGPRPRSRPPTTSGPVRAVPARPPRDDLAGLRLVR